MKAGEEGVRAGVAKAGFGALFGAALGDAQLHGEKLGENEVFASE